MIDYKFEEKIQELLEPYHQIAIYGTGEATERFWPLIENLHYTERIKHFIDRKQSIMQKKKFHGYVVCQIADIITDIDVIVIGSANYWREIKERIVLFLKKENIHIPIIAIYDDSPNSIRENSLSECISYVHYLENVKEEDKKKFVSFSEIPYIRKREDPKVIAWYLPQFYQIEENDRFHGKGFTEWTNSSQGKPLFVGHEQPHIPYDVGYYDLSHSDIMSRQIQLAKHYGIYGFCFHYYWFSGKKTMEVPIQNFLANKELDMPFCLNWATENWTSVWDGGKYDIIFEQKMEKEDEEKFFKDILPYFKDSRYIKISNKPLFIIYTVIMFDKEKFRVFLNYLNEMAKKEGFDGLYILLGNYKGFDENVIDYGADALVEFPPAEIGKKKYELEIEGYLNPYYLGKIYDYKNMILDGGHILIHKNKAYRSAAVGFDNSVRKPKWGGVIYFKSNPDLFKKWLHDIINENRNTDLEKIVFVSSWNEWAEGSHLEPDIRYGYAYLEAVKEAIYETRKLDTAFVYNKIDAIIEKGEKPVLWIICTESLGDVVAAEPIARLLKKKYSSCFVKWVVNKSYEEIVRFNPYIDEIVGVSNLGEAISLYNEVEIKKGNVIINCHYNMRRCTVTNKYISNQVNPMITEKTYFNFGSLLTSFSLIAGLPAINEKPIFYIDTNIINPFKGKKYVVFHCKSADAKKDWTNKGWEELSIFFQKKEISIIEIGLESCISTHGANYIDYTGERSIQKIASVIRDAEYFIGVDSGFAHIANCYEKNATILMGKYKNFENPMPYSGYFASSSTVLYSKGITSELSYCDVIMDIEKKFSLGKH